MFCRRETLLSLPRLTVYLQHFSFAFFLPDLEMLPLNEASLPLLIQVLHVICLQPELGL